MSTPTLPPKALHIDLLEEIASKEGVSPLDLPPLYDAVDREIFESLTSPDGYTAPLLFTYSGYDVIVDRDGHITVAGTADH